jgi:hypothetical protein
MRQPDLGIFHLPRSSFTAKLRNNFVDHAHAGGADRVAK